MSLKTLSAVLEKKIRRLCLKDFPCGKGPWRKTRDCTEEPERETVDALLDLLRCPQSPWWQENESWSPQASALRELAVLTPERLDKDLIYSHFTILRIVDKGVSVIDDGLLKFSKLEELVLSANEISEITVKNLPRTLRILELRGNCLTSLSSLADSQLPQLQYLSLGSNTLGSHKDASHLTGRHWPRLICLDLSDCEFQDQQVLLNALSTLYCLKTLVLEGNPFTLSPAYPGLTVDSLPQLTCLDGLWISPEQRHHFTGLAKMSDLTVDMASTMVSVGRLRGIPHPLTSVDEKSTPVIYRYFVTYEFLSHQTPHHSKPDSEFKIGTASKAHVREASSISTALQSNKNCEREMSRPDPGVLADKTADTARLSQHSTSNLMWSETMDFKDTQTYVVKSLKDLKSFFSQGLYLRLEEEKCQVKSSSTKDKPKDKNKKSVPELVQDPPIRRTLASAHVPLRSLVRAGKKVQVFCDFGVFYTYPEVEATQAFQKDLVEKTKNNKKKEDMKANHKEHNKSPKNTSSKGGRGEESKDGDVAVRTDNHEPVQLEPLTPVTVELSVELEKWESASDALRLVPQHHSS